jgi:hypothetical protein
MSTLPDFSYFPPSDVVLAKRVEDMQTMQICTGVLSFVASASVVCTVVLFPSMWQSKIYMKMIVMVSLSDAFAAFALIFGFPTGVLCNVQGFLLFYFYRTSWLWSCLMLFQLNHVVSHARIYYSFVGMNCFVWIVNLILQLLPLSTGTFYTNSSEYAGKSICTFDAFDPNYFNWLLEGFILPLALTTVVLIGLAAMLYLRLRHLKSEFKKSLVGSLILYPTQILFTSSPLLFFFFTHWNHKQPTAADYEPASFMKVYTVVQVIYAWTGLQGLFNCLIFFSNSTEARARWRIYLAEKCGCAIAKPTLAAGDVNAFRRDSDTGSIGGAQMSDPMEHQEKLSTFAERRSLLGVQEDFLDDGEIERTIKMENDTIERSKTNNSRNSSPSTGGLKKTNSRMSTENNDSARIGDKTFGGHFGTHNDI